MDSIKTRNEYVDNLYANVKPALIVKRGKKENSYVDFIVVKSTEKDCNTLLEQIENKTLLQFPEYIINQLKSLTFIEKVEDIKDCLFIGKLSEYNGYRSLVYKFPQSRRQIMEGKDICYRAYFHSLEEQKNIVCHVNACPTPESSWESVQIATNSKYGIIIKVIKDVNIS
jgi:hypothetical protein